MARKPARPSAHNSSRQAHEVWGNPCSNRTVRPSCGPQARPVNVNPPASISSRSIAPIVSTTLTAPPSGGGAASGADLVRAQPERLLGDGVDERPLRHVVVRNGGE